jgi:hypothetical protein
MSKIPGPGVLAKASDQPVDEGQVEFRENGTTSPGFAPVIRGVATLVINRPLTSGSDGVTAS